MAQPRYGSDEWPYVWPLQKGIVGGQEGWIDPRSPDVPKLLPVNLGRIEGELDIKKLHRRNLAEDKANQAWFRNKELPSTGGPNAMRQQLRENTRLLKERNQQERWDNSYSLLNQSDIAELQGVAVENAPKRITNLEAEALFKQEEAEITAGQQAANLENQAAQGWASYYNTLEGFSEEDRQGAEIARTSKEPFNFEVPPLSKSKNYKILTDETKGSSTDIVKIGEKDDKKKGEGKRFVGKGRNSIAANKERIREINPGVVATNEWRERQNVFKAAQDSLKTASTDQVQDITYRNAYAAPPSENYLSFGDNIKASEDANFSTQKSTAPDKKGLGQHIKGDTGVQKAANVVGGIASGLQALLQKDDEKILPGFGGSSIASFNRNWRNVV